MKIYLYAGIILIVLGIASLVVPIPHTETIWVAEEIGDADQQIAKKGFHFSRGLL